jgi:hypothetical protein
VHLLAAITPHGFGHAAQIAPVLNVLRQRHPKLRLTLLTSLPRAFLRGRIQGDFELIEEAPDFGLIMSSALAIDLDASAAAYRRLHDDWDACLDREAQRLRRLSPTLVLADVPYLTLAAADRAGIPAVAMCSLNWADVYRHYFLQRPEAPGILEQMEEAYRSARVFLCPEPSMPMPFLDRRVAIGPIATVGRSQGKALREQLRLGADQRLILVAPGGVSARFPMETWPAGQGIHWLVSAHWQVRHADASSYQDTGLAFTDLIASCDAVLGKCGYGTVTECAVNGTPLMYVPRPDWPEEATLLRWLQDRHGAVAVEAQRLESGRFADLMEPLQSLRPSPCEADGASQAADWISGYFG